MEFKTLCDYVSCPFCAGEYAPVKTTEGYSVVHTEPQCAEFIAMDVLTFIQAAREKKQEKLPKGNN